MKTYNSIKKICKNCKIIKRKKKSYVFCNSFYKHKQKQKFFKKC